jgi:hypothetical protein
MLEEFWALLRVDLTSGGRLGTARRRPLVFRSLRPSARQPLALGSDGPRTVGPEDVWYKRLSVYNSLVPWYRFGTMVQAGSKAPAIDGVEKVLRWDW